jgi:predicted amidophosphoribosyltransferase
MIGFGLYRYEGPVRDLVLEAKVASCGFMYQLVQELWRQELTLRMWAASVDAIMPAPSSLWSRFHGRLDLAYGLARVLAKELDVPLLMPPLKLAWRWRKRARTSGARRRSWQRPMPNHHDRLWPAKPRYLLQRLLLVDDVLTSGQTLNQLALNLGAYDCKFAVLAYAPQQDTKGGFNKPNLSAGVAKYGST